MLDFIVNNYNLFVIVGVLLLLGLFGYIMDRKKYEKYREEILNEGNVSQTLSAAPNIDTTAKAISVDEEDEKTPEIDEDKTEVISLNLNTGESSEDAKPEV